MRKWKNRVNCILAVSLNIFVKSLFEWISIIRSRPGEELTIQTLDILNYLYIAFYGSPASKFSWKKYTHLYSTSIPSMVVTWLIRITSTTDYLRRSHFEFCSTNPPSKKGNCYSPLKINILWTPPFSKFIFPKSSRASAHQFWARSVQPFSRKKTFFVKNWPIWKM